MHLTPIRKPRTFRGVNFITQDVVGYFRGHLKGRTVHVELSKENPPYWSQTVGKDPNGGPLWGVTVKRPDGERLDPDPSFCAESREEALARLEEL